MAPIPKFCGQYPARQNREFIQYFVYPPFALTTAATLLGMLSIKLLHTSGEILPHSLTTCSHNSFIPLGSTSYPARVRFRCCHKCSMGLRSGDCAGHSSTS